MIPNPALLIGDVLVVTDLHLGFEGELREHGIRIPSQTNQILQQLLNIIEREKARRLVILGDVKHGVPSISYDEWRHIPRFLETLSSKVSSLDIIIGNHDGDLLPLTPRSIKVHPPQGMKVGDAWLVHGHALPSPKARNAGLMMMGHIHPAIELKDRFGFRLIQPVWLKCKGKSSTVVVMPSFNRMIGHLLINKRGRGKFGPVLRWAKIDIDECEAFTLDGILLGRIKELKA